MNSTHIVCVFDSSLNLWILISKTLCVCVCVCVCVRGGEMELNGLGGIIRRHFPTSCQSCHYTKWPVLPHDCRDASWTVTEELLQCKKHTILNTKTRKTTKQMNINVIKCTFYICECVHLYLIYHIKSLIEAFSWITSHILLNPTHAHISITKPVKLIKI